MSPHPTAFALDRYAETRDTAPADDPVRLHVDACESCRAEVDATLAAHRKFRVEVMPRTLPEVERRTAPWRFLGFAALVPALGAAALVLLVRTSPTDTGAALDDGTLPADVRVKDSAGLDVVLRRDGRITRAAPGTTFRAGDELRFVVHAAGRTHALLVGIDAKGTVSVYAPFDGTASLALPAGPNAELPGSIQLDDTPGPERLFLLLSAAPLAVSDLRPSLDALAARGPDALRSTDRLPLGRDDVVQVSKLLEKTP